MCLFPRLIKNPRYLPNKKNGGYPIPCTDERKLYVPVGCGNCIECRRQKAIGWKIRLNEEIKIHKFAYMVTMTFAPSELEQLMNELGLQECNKLACKAVRRFLERWRKNYKKSLKHFFITELGHEGTERIHLHGIIFNDFEITKEMFNDYWKYGRVDVGDWCNEVSIGYIIKYITKLDPDHKGYMAEIYASPGLGKCYLDRDIVKEIHQYRGDKTTEFYRFRNGTKVALPMYYRMKLFDDDQREEMWLRKIDQHTRYVLGCKIENINTDTGYQSYLNVLKHAQDLNRETGYGDTSKEWQKKVYDVTAKMINKSRKP